VRSRLVRNPRPGPRCGDLTAGETLKLAREILSETGDLRLADLGVRLGGTHHRPGQPLVGLLEAASGDLRIGVPAQVQCAPADVVGKGREPAALRRGEAVPARMNGARDSHAEDGRSIPGTGHDRMVLHRVDGTGSLARRGSVR
jgi:hypothetical protein